MISSFIASVAAAAGLAALVGLERGLRGKPIDAVTGALVAIGSAAFIALGESVTSATSDPTRTLGQIASGVGFLGAGTIVAQKNRVTGVTTAATVWVLAAIGAACGMHHFSEATILTMTALAALIASDAIAGRMKTGENRKKDLR